ncbi:MAG: helix-turn-helix domain-containing protein [Candidatus Acidiferrales bacterium]
MPSQRKGVSQMMIGQRLRKLRESKNLSQGDVEKRTGLLRCYTSRVENGHTVPTVETLEKYARALEIPTYRFFYEGDKPPEKLQLPVTQDGDGWGASGAAQRELRAFAKLLSRMDDNKRKLLLVAATWMARGRRT